MYEVSKLYVWLGFSGTALALYAEVPRFNPQYRVKTKRPYLQTVYIILLVSPGQLKTYHNL